MTVLAFDAEAHEYRLDGRVLPSVTTIISEILGQQWRAADWYLQRGRAVHACAAYIARGIEFKHDPQIDGQVQALRRFFSTVKPEIISTEEEMASSVYRFAGTSDLICKVSGRKAIIDFKASMDLERVALQLGGYATLTEEVRKEHIRYGYGVEIREDGTYRMTDVIELRRMRREFLALRTVYGIRERMGLIQKEES